MTKSATQRTLTVGTHQHRNSFSSKLMHPFVNIIDKVCGLDVLDDMYQNITERNVHAFIKEALAALGISYTLSTADLKKIPTEGALVITANHPYGGVEGLIMADILLTVRPDAKIMVNQLISVISELQSLFIFVDPIRRHERAKKRNILSLRETLTHLKGGGALGIFPAGEVAHLSFKHMKVREKTWESSVARIIKLSHATVLPLFFEGRNSLLFNAVGIVHSALRMAMLPRELYKKQQKNIHVAIGAPVLPEKIGALGSNTAVMGYLQQRSLIMQHRTTSNCRVFQFKAEKPREAIVEAIPEAVLAEEVASLPPEQLLFKNKDYAVYYGLATELPHVMAEIARLRELTFRDVGEGTGKRHDIDSFDSYYTQLFVWNPNRNEIVGAYRMAKTDEVIEAKGTSGLYSSTLFKYDDRFFDVLGPALEMGRSFVRPEYQRDFSPLLLLWKGISAYVLKYPKYKTLFGLVSISNEYKKAARQMMSAYWGKTREDSPFSPYFSSKHPPKVKKALRKLAEHIETEDDLVSVLADIDPERGLPPLLKQYLKLGGKVLGFAVDPAFSNTLDGLIVVDLTQAPPKQLSRYMGESGAKLFLGAGAFSA